MQTQSDTASLVATPSVELLARETAREHRAAFGVEPALAAYAPGRIEILGNHTDYNEGFVLSAAIDAGTCATLSPWAPSEVRLFSTDGPRHWTVPLDEAFRPETVDASAYVGGMLHRLLDGTPPRGGACLAVHRDLPLGAGLSSSAALTLATGLVFARHAGLSPTPLDLARAAQRAERDYAGVHCGLLDPITSLHGRREAMVLTDFRTLEVRTVPMPEGAVFLMVDTGTKHRLVDSAYNERRTRCEQAASELSRLTGRSLPALRDVDVATLEAFPSGLDPVTFRRAAHVVGENERVMRGVRALSHGDLAAFGQLMFASHESSRTQFENSCPELDLLVTTAAGIPGVFGARLSGGGFGGSAVVLVATNAADRAATALRAAYREAFGRDPATRVVRPSDGARLLT